MPKHPEPKLFIPKNPKKYAGDPRKIVARSNLERRFFKYFDDHPGVVKWASEEIFIPYISPVDNKPHRYFVDLLIKTNTGQVFMIEIKPHSKTLPPKPSKNKKTYAQNVMEHEVIMAKKRYAEEYCKKRNIKFLFLTEKDLKIKW